MDMKNFLRNKMYEFGSDNFKQYLCVEVIHDWAKIVDADIADKVKPVKIEHGILFVDVNNSAFKDQLKFYAEDIIDAVNVYVEENVDAVDKNFAQNNEPLVKEIKIAKAFQVADMPRKEQLPAQDEQPKLTIEQITLTDEETKQCEERAAKISDEELRQIVLDTLLSQARVQKFRLLNGWHKCETCSVLCPPEEIFCEVCSVKQRDAMVDELYRIMYDNPWLNARDVQKILLERMPHMSKECSFEAIESARTSLIQKVAGSIRFGDEESDEALRLVMLEKRLTSDKLTPTIIRRTLIDLQFNLADQSLILRYYTRSKRKKK